MKPLSNSALAFFSIVIALALFSGSYFIKTTTVTKKSSPATIVTTTHLNHGWPFPYNIESTKATSGVNDHFVLRSTNTMEHNAMHAAIDLVLSLVIAVSAILGLEYVLRPAKRR
jgi:hypothetical protein